MQKTLNLRVLPRESVDDRLLLPLVAVAAGVPVAEVSGYKILKRSIDARGRQAVIQLSLQVFIGEPVEGEAPAPMDLRDVRSAAHSAVIIGAGPAGLFCALQLIALGIRPVILERGKDVRARRRDLAKLNREGIVNPDSNYCFGEGGAGTYSDGKLYTRSGKRGDIQAVLRTLVQFGADPRILYEAHPHIGTNKLPGIITAMREAVVAHGGEVHFEQRVTRFLREGHRIRAVVTAAGAEFPTGHLVLAAGHSARDLFEGLHSEGIAIEFKPFALGVRVEHPQALIDSIQYKSSSREEWLPPASYSLVQQVEGRGVFSFCMCPGGIIAPAATAPGEIVVNGWSPSKRDNPYANSGMVVSIEAEDVRPFAKDGPLAGLRYQQSVERAAFLAGGGGQTAPAQRLTDFTRGVRSTSLPDCSYLPGIVPADLGEVLPPRILTALAEGFRQFGKRMRGYLTEEAVVVATESRTSSPVRIPRDRDRLTHPDLHNLYPCGEGAGYAGGIVSAAMDGMRVAGAIAQLVR